MPTLTTNDLASILLGTEHGGSRDSIYRVSFAVPNDLLGVEQGGNRSAFSFGLVQLDIGSNTFAQNAYIEILNNSRELGVINQAHYADLKLYVGRSRYDLDSLLRDRYVSDKDFLSGSIFSIDSNKLIVDKYNDLYLDHSLLPTVQNFLNAMSAAWGTDSVFNEENPDYYLAVSAITSLANRFGGLTNTTAHFLTEQPLSAANVRAWFNTRLPDTNENDWQLVQEGARLFAELEESDGGGDPAPTTVTVDLATLTMPQGYRIDGAAAFDVTGTRVAWAGDVNGDGYDDIVIGANEADFNGRPGSGSAYVIFGKAGGFGTIDLESLASKDGIRIDGAASDDNTASSIARAGDINGDGFDDLVIGAVFADNSGDLSGSSYVVFGGRNLTNIDLASLTLSRGFRIDGEADDNWSGLAVAAAGDVNDDGIDDLIIGAPRNPNEGWPTAGAAYVIFGRTDEPANISLAALVPSQGFRIGGETGTLTVERFGGHAGFSVGSVGDVNADGIDDFFVGANYLTRHSPLGSSYVVYGKAGGWSGFNLGSMTATDGFRIDYAEGGTGSVGGLMAPAGDMNGDGIADLLLSAVPQDSAKPGAGAVFVVYGRSGGLGNIDLGSLTSGQGLRIDGAVEGDLIGLSAASAGDFNGDGRDDLVISSPIIDNNGRPDSGSTYVIFGRAGGLPNIDLAAFDGTMGLRFDGAAFDDQSGHSVSTAGDVNGDGYDDIVVGARLTDNNGRIDSGSAYVIFGGPFGGIELASPIAGGYRVKVTQAPGATSHRDDLYHAWDFVLDGAASYGAPVVAVASGRVVFVKADVPDGDAWQPAREAGDNSIGPPGGLGNVVTLEHVIDGRRFYSSYVHLRDDDLTQDLYDRWQASLTGGPAVSLAAGEILGAIGNTGFRQGTHLHLNLGTEFGSFETSIDGVDYVFDDYQIAKGPPDDPILGLVRFIDAPAPNGHFRAGDIFGAIDPLAFSDPAVPNSAPVVAGDGVEWLAAGQSLSASAFVRVTDADGASDLARVTFWDSTPGDDGGFLTLDGVAINGASVAVPVEQLHRVGYRAGNEAGSNRVLVEATDRRGAESNSFFVEFRVEEATATPVIAPNGTLTVQAGSRIRLLDLLSISDRDGVADIAGVRLRDPGGPAGGLVLTGPGPFRHPVGDGKSTAAIDGDGYYIFQRFGVPNPDVNNSVHLGVDWNGEGGGNSDLGDAVYAAANGTVIKVVTGKDDSTTPFGNYVVLRHDLAQPITYDGQVVTRVNTLYAHLQSVEKLALNDVVTIGTKIGAIGKSGDADGVAHLHFEITTGATLPNTDDGYNPSGAPPAWIDPYLFIEQNRSGTANLGTDTGWRAFTDLDDIQYVASQALGDDRISVLVRDQAGTVTQRDLVIQVRPEAGQANLERMPFTEIAVGDQNFLTAEQWQQLLGSGNKLIQGVQSGLELAGKWNAQQLAEAQAAIGLRVFQTDKRIAELNYNSDLLAGVDSFANYALAAKNVLQGGDPATELYAASRDTLISIASGYVGTATFALGAKALVAAGFMSAGAPVVLLGVGTAVVAFGASQLLETYFPETADGLVDVVSAAPRNFVNVFRSLNPFYGGSGGLQTGDGSQLAAPPRLGWSLDLDTGALQTVASVAPDLWNFALARFGVTGELQQGLELVGDRSGSPTDDILVGSPADDRIAGERGNDFLSGLDGDDRLEGSTGGDTLIGGIGADALGGGADADSLLGAEGRDSLDGGPGADTLMGGAEGDVYVVDDRLDLVIEADTLPGAIDEVIAGVTWTLGANVERLALSGASTISGTGNTLANVITGNGLANTLDGLDGADTLSGGVGRDSLSGGAGADSLNGGAGADTMAGGAGNDTYVADSTADFVFEAAAAGTTDLVVSAVAWTLGANIERLILTGASTIAGTGNTVANAITGNGVANTLSGLEGADTLSGGAGADSLSGGNGADSLNGDAGADSMTGGAGNDTFIADNIGDRIFEAAGGGTADLVRSAVSFSLGEEVEQLVLTGPANLSGTGNSLNNLLTGNGGANTLAGGGGNDSLVGGRGADSLNGDAGADTMAGGFDGDRYVVDSLLDVVSETDTTPGVIDVVISGVAWTLGANLERLLLTGDAIAGTGNTLANLLIGNGAANALSGLEGADTLSGGEGADSLNGGAGGDSLNGGAGADSMAGGTGNDTFIADDANDRAIEEAGGGIADLVRASVSFSLGTEVERLVLTGTANLVGAGNASNNLLTGNDGANTLSGAEGADSLSGGAGADTLAGGAGADSLDGGFGRDAFRFGSAAEGADSVIGYVTADDVIQVSASGFGGGLLGPTAMSGFVALEAAFFTTGAAGATTSEAQRFIWDGAAKVLWWDADGSAGGFAPVRIAAFTGSVTLNATEIQVVA